MTWVQHCHSSSEYRNWKEKKTTGIELHSKYSIIDLLTFDQEENILIGQMWQIFMTVRIVRLAIEAQMHMFQTRRTGRSRGQTQRPNCRAKTR